MDVVNMLNAPKRFLKVVDSRMPDTCDSQWMCHGAAERVNQDRVEFATFPALGLLNDILLVGTASTFGNYWNGGLGIYRLPVSLYKNTLLPKPIDLIPERVSFTGFEASVASIAVLRQNDLKETTPVGVGLDDGSIQLIRMPSKIDEGMDRNSKLTLSINSATYHDWPIQRIVNSNGKLASLDVAGVVKTWDLQQFVPTSSWSIESYSWPQAGHSLEPDLAARPQPDSNHFSLASLSPCDPRNQLALWDSRLSTMRGPCLRWADKLTDSFDLPRSICWLTSTLLVLGTFNGFVHLYDVRFVREATEPTVISLSSLDAREWIGSPLPADIREGTNQIIEMVTYPTGQPDLCQCVALIGLDLYCPDGTQFTSNLASKPTISADEISASVVRVTFVMEGLRAPRQGLAGLFAAGCSGKFCSEDNSMQRAHVTQMLGNGTLEIILDEWTLNLKCTLIRPDMVYEHHVQQFPDKIAPTQCEYQVKNNMVILRLKKAPGSGSWAGTLKTKGLN
ncbi:hypothetical protein P879_01379 [Paragonimus westermani]|uniref:Uncharacterized protein n=1 Tax=Paragonimus westermani TaxID=34504 RepID=A0A8T0DX05_9TREM|nr:hypothetical protein P879_01379 [Paragonimus westermani]